MVMMKVCGKMPSKVRLEKNWGTSVNERAIYCKILSLSGKTDNHIPCFLCAVATLMKLIGVSEKSHVCQIEMSINLGIQITVI